MEDDYHSDSTGAIYCDGCGRVIGCVSVSLDGHCYCPQCAERIAPAEAGEE